MKERTLMPLSTVYHLTIINNIIGDIPELLEVFPIRQFQDRPSSVIEGILLVTH